MEALKELRNNEIRIDMSIQPIEESYSLLQKYQIEIPREEIERCDTLRYSWQKLLALASQTSGHLLDIQPLYKDGLKGDVENFTKDCLNFYASYRNVIYLNALTLNLNINRFKNKIKFIFRFFFVCCCCCCFQKNGPMVAGVAPREASDRLFIYQNQFDALYRKYITYTEGEELFGLPVTEYPDLLQIR